MQIIISDRMLIACVSFFLFLLQTNHNLAPDVEHCFLFVCFFFNSVEKLRGIKLVFVVQVL